MFFYYNGDSRSSLNQLQSGHRSVQLSHFALKRDQNSVQFGSYKGDNATFILLTQSLIFIDLFLTYTTLHSLLNDLQCVSCTAKRQLLPAVPGFFLEVQGCLEAFVSVLNLLSAVFGPLIGRQTSPSSNLLNLERISKPNFLVWTGLCRHFSPIP